MNESLGQESRIEHFSKVWSSNDPSFLFSPLKLSSLFWGMLIGEGNGNPLQYSCLENPTDGGAWWAAIYGVAQSRTWLKRLSSSSSSTLFQVTQMVKSTPAMQETWVWYLGREDPLEEEMVTHSSILVWRIPWTEKPGRLQSLRPQSIRHNWVTKHALTHPFH